MELEDQERLKYMSPQLFDYVRRKMGARQEQQRFGFQHGQPADEVQDAMDADEPAPAVQEPLGPFPQFAPVEGQAFDFSPFQQFFQSFEERAVQREQQAEARAVQRERGLERRLSRRIADSEGRLHQDIRRSHHELRRRIDDVADHFGRRMHAVENNTYDIMEGLRRDYVESLDEGAVADDRFEFPNYQRLFEIPLPACTGYPDYEYQSDAQLAARSAEEEALYSQPFEYTHLPAYSPQMYSAWDVYAAQQYQPLPQDPSQDDPTL